MSAIRTTDELTPAELHGLTGHKRPERQAAALVSLGIPFRAAGRRLFVDRRIVEHWPQWEKTRCEVRLDMVR